MAKQGSMVTLIKTFYHDEFKWYGALTTFLGYIDL